MKPQHAIRYDFCLWLRMTEPSMSQPSADAASLYLDLLKRCLTRVPCPDRTLDWDLVATRPLDPAVRLDYRSRHGITDPIETVDWTGVF